MRVQRGQSQDGSGAWEAFPNQPNKLFFLGSLIEKAHEEENMK